MEIYDEEDFEGNLKPDNSPLTKADKTAHKIIKQNLAPLKVPIISEEGINVTYEKRRQWKKRLVS